MFPTSSIQTYTLWHKAHHSYLTSIKFTHACLEEDRSYSQCWSSSTGGHCLTHAYLLGVASIALLPYIHCLLNTWPVISLRAYWQELTNAASVLTLNDSAVGS